MLPNPQSFRVHDVRAFPVVRVLIGAQEPGYAPQWICEMDLLLALGRPFVLLFDGDRGEESHEDRKQRGQWLKRNKDALQAVCKGMIGIEPEALARTILQARAVITAKAFGIPMEVVATAVEAEARVREQLKIPV
ncbi:hypothetical protein [Bradyrhizobium sp. 2TAF24]|uniref:hypothetical protein n=1 Tax=Bradyrhizobium sp. 2TAF24 TaxID=3233011 RepID=UPI003F8F63E8